MIVLTDCLVNNLLCSAMIGIVFKLNCLPDVGIGWVIGGERVIGG